MLMLLPKKTNNTSNHNIEVAYVYVIKKGQGILRAKIRLSLLWKMYMPQKEVSPADV